MKIKTLAVSIFIGALSIVHATTLDWDISDKTGEEFSMDAAYDVVNIYGEGSINIALFRAAAGGTQLNIRDGASVTLGNMMVSDGPIVLNLEDSGASFLLVPEPTIIVELDSKDLSKEGELIFPSFYYDSEQIGDMMANFGIMNAIINSKFEFVTTDGNPYEHMTEVSMVQTVLSDMHWNIPVGETVFSVKATNTQVIPEPATVTLSLLALTGMVTRRRRK